MSDIGAVIFQWLKRIGLEYAIPAFENMSITSPHALMNMQWEHYDALGIHDQDDRKRLYELVQRVRDASRKGNEVRRPRQSLAPGLSPNNSEQGSHGPPSLPDNLPSRESILGAGDLSHPHLEMARVASEYRRETLDLSIDDTGDEEDEDSGLISSERLGSRVQNDDETTGFSANAPQSSANVPTSAPRQPPASFRRLRVMPSASAAFKKREAEAAAAAASGSAMSAGIGPNSARPSSQRVGVPRQSISNQPLSRRILSTPSATPNPAVSASDSDTAFGSGDFFSADVAGGEVKQRRTSLPIPGSRVPSSMNVLSPHSMAEDSDSEFDTDHMRPTNDAPSVPNNRATVKIDNILCKKVLVDPDAPRIRVVVRKRPMSKREADAQELDVVNIVTKTELQVHEIKRKVDLTRYTEASEFAFDDVFDETVTTEQIYKHTAQPLISSIFNGANATCFAYGQTGSGKTYTMMGNLKDGGKLYDAETGQCKSNAGLYVLAARDIFFYLDAFHQANKVEQVRGFDKRGSRRYCVVVSFYEIYGGKLFDLLNNREPLKALVDAKGDVNVLGIVEQPVFGVDSLLKYIDHGIGVRSTGSTGANADSSRSHAVLQITLAHAQADGKGGLSVISDPRTRHVAAKGKFSFIDLAGSERGADTFKNDRKTRLEGAEINKSLLALKECIRSLYHQADYNPFRGSKLTQVLKDSFIGDAHTVMIATISPNQSNTEHTLNTLRYAYRLKEIGGGNAETEYDPPYGLRGEANEYGEEPYDNRAESLMTVPGGPLGGLSNYLANQAGANLHMPHSSVGAPAIVAPPLPTPSSRSAPAAPIPPPTAVTSGDSTTSGRPSAVSSIPTTNRGSIQGRSAPSLSSTSVSAALNAIGTASAVASAVAASARKSRDTSSIQRKSSSVAPVQSSLQKPTTSSALPQPTSRGSSIVSRPAGSGIPSRSAIPSLANRRNSITPTDASPNTISTPSPRKDRSNRDASTTARMRALSGSPITTSPYQRNPRIAPEHASPVRQSPGSPYSLQMLHAQQDISSPREMLVDAKTPASSKIRKELVSSPLLGPARPSGQSHSDPPPSQSNIQNSERRVWSRNEDDMNEDMDDTNMHSESNLDTSTLSTQSSDDPFHNTSLQTNEESHLVPLTNYDTALLNNHITTLRRLEMLASREKLEIKSFLSGPEESAMAGREGLASYVSHMSLLVTKKMTLLKSLLDDFSGYNDLYGSELQQLSSHSGKRPSSSSSHKDSPSSASTRPKYPDSVTSPIPVRSPIQAKKYPKVTSYSSDTEI